MHTPSNPTIEVFADIWCPFAHVGLRAVDEQRARSGRSDVAIWVRAWPLELVNGSALDPVVTAEHADDLRRQVAPSLFEHLDVDRFPSSTLNALALASRAYRTDPRPVSGSASRSGTHCSRKAGISPNGPLSNPLRTTWAWRCPTSPIAPAYWRTGARDNDEAFSDRRTSSVLRPTCSVLHSTSRRIRPRCFDRQERLAPQRVPGALFLPIRSGMTRTALLRRTRRWRHEKTC